MSAWLRPVALAAAVLATTAATADDGGHATRTGFFPHAIAIADVNGDGVPDVLVPASAERKVNVLLSDGRGGFRVNHSYPVGH